MKRPADKAAYLVIAPVPQHKFEASGMNGVPSVKWVQQQDAFMPYADESAVLLLPFTNADLGEVFFLSLGQDPEHDETQLLTSIELNVPKDPDEALYRNGKADKSYSETIDGGRVVFVTIRSCRDPSVADYVVNISL